MARYFFDTSAIAKRYVLEPGQAWVQNLCDPPGQHTLYISQLALVEVANVMCVKAAIKMQGERPPGQERIRAGRDALINVFLGHCDPTGGQYYVRLVTSALYPPAIELRKKYAMGSLDALQLACAIELRDAHAARGMSRPEFVCADTNLRRAAYREGFQVRNPEDYASAGELANAQPSSAATPVIDDENMWRQWAHILGAWLLSR